MAKQSPQPRMNPISGGSMREANLAGVTSIALPADRARSDSPFMEGVRRLRKSTTAIIGFFIVVALVVSALFADVLAPQSPTASDQTRTFQRPSG